MPKYELSQLHEYLTNVLQLEAVACKRLADKQGRPFRNGQSGPPAMPRRIAVAVERLRCRQRTTVVKKALPPLWVMPPSRLPTRLPSSILSVSEALTNLVLGTACRRAGQRIALRQLDVALPFAGRRRPPLQGCKSVERLLLRLTNQCAYRQRLPSP